MKILLIILTFHLISGPVHCSEVIGYPGGYVIIDFKYQINIMSTVYFCKIKTQALCEPLIAAQGRQLVPKGVQKDRFSLFGSSGLFTLIFRNLSLQDAGMYQGGVIEPGWNHNINLKVKSDPCCSRTRTATGYLGQTVTISCSYPVEFETNSKSFFKLDGLAVTEVIRTSGTEPHQESRFSISDNSRNKVFSVNINDVKEDDGGVYFCAVDNEGTAVNYHSLFTVIQLQVTEVPKDTTENPDGTSDTTQPDLSIIISVVVCVILLLGVGLALIIYKQRWNKSQGSFHRNKLEGLSEIPPYEEVKDHKPCSDTEATAYYSTIPLSTIPSNPPNTVYATAQLPTIPSDPPNTVYATAELPTIPSDPPNTVYATAQLPTIPSDPPNTVYATAELPTIPSDPPNTVYATAELPTIPSDPPNTVYTTIPSDPPNTVYATAQLPTIPSDPPNTVYATAELPTIPSDPPNTVYATAQLPTIPSDPPNTVYATAELPTISSDPPNTV